MKFARKLLSSRSAVSALTHMAPSSFVATDSKKIVFEIAVMGRVDNADVTVTEDFGDTCRLTAVLRFSDEVGHERHERHGPHKHYGPHVPDASEGQIRSTPFRLKLKDLLLRNGGTAQNIVLWVLYGIWLIVSSIH